jgi:hypothetical protein
MTHKRGDPEVRVLRHDPLVRRRHAAKLLHFQAVGWVQDHHVVVQGHRWDGGNASSPTEKQQRQEQSWRQPCCGAKHA